MGEHVYRWCYLGLLEHLYMSYQICWLRMFCKIANNESNQKWFPFPLSLVHDENNLPFRSHINPMWREYLRCPSGSAYINPPSLHIRLYGILLR